MGLKIFPHGTLPNGNKVPLIDDWENRATDDTTQHSKWIEQYGNRITGWALPLKPNGLFALDIDVKSDGRNGFKYLQEQGINLPQVAHQQTPSGGLHLFFKDNPNLNLRNTVNRQIGIDSRAGGGYVWLYQPNFSLPILDIPQWVHDIIRKPINHVDPTQVNTYKLDPTLALQQYSKSIQSLLDAQPGERNQTLNIQAYLIGKLVAAGAISYERAFEDLTNAANKIGLDPYETQATILSGLKGGVAKPLTHPFGDKPPTPAMTIEAPLPQAEVHVRWTPRFALIEELTNWTKLKRPQLFKNWSPQDIILTSAIGGVGKTTLKLYEAVCLALGQSFLGFECIKPGRTLFIIGEDSEEKLYAMLGKICKDMGILDQAHLIQAVRENVVIKLATDLSLVSFNRALNNYVVNLNDLSKIKEAIDDLRPASIVFDPIGMFAGPESGGNDAAKGMMQAMQQLLKYSDASIEMISHIGKDSATRKDVGQFSARGATSIANHSRVVRTLLKLNANEYKEETGEDLGDDTTAIKCFVSKFSDGSPLLDKPFLIMRKGYLFSRKDINSSKSNDELSESKQRNKKAVYDYVKLLSTEERPLTYKVVSSHFNLSVPKIPKTEVRSILTMLEHEGLLEEVPHHDVTVGDWLRPI